MQLKTHNRVVIGPTKFLKVWAQLDSFQIKGVRISGHKAQTGMLVSLPKYFACIRKSDQQPCTERGGKATGTVLVRMLYSQGPTPWASNTSGSIKRDCMAEMFPLPYNLSLVLKNISTLKLDLPDTPATAAPTFFTRPGILISRTTHTYIIVT